MKNIKQLAAVLGVASILTACSSTPLPQDLEYKVICFDRDIPRRFENEMNTLASEGWTINGPLGNEGTNNEGNTCLYFLFQRKKTDK